MWMNWMLSWGAQAGVHQPHKKCLTVAMEVRQKRSQAKHVTYPTTLCWVVIMNEKGFATKVDKALTNLLSCQTIDHLIIAQRMVQPCPAPLINLLLTAQACHGVHKNDIHKQLPEQALKQWHTVCKHVLKHPACTIVSQLSFDLDLIGVNWGFMLEISMTFICSWLPAELYSQVLSPGYFKSRVTNRTTASWSCKCCRKWESWSSLVPKTHAKHYMLWCFIT